jgi:alkaline phosphatase
MKRMFTNLMVVAVIGLCAAAAQAQQAKNVFLMISDGIGFNGWEAAKYDQGTLPYDNEDFVFYGMTTYMNNVRDLDTGEMLDSNSGAVKGADAADHNWEAVPQGYDPVKMWEDFEYHRNKDGRYNGFTDSAAAATAMYTGVKTYNSAISYSVQGEELKTIAEIAAEKGMATAAVSSVQFSHATPAAVDAHTYYRYNKQEIASQMLQSDLDVIMGGDAYVDSEGEFPAGVDGWKSIASADEFGQGFEVVDEADEWDALLAGTDLPQKVVGTFEGSTLDGRARPKLAEMTDAALKVLENNTEAENGMFMMVEGGAVDWQNHGNNLENMLREQRDFDASVQKVIDWINANDSDWNESILIVTSDHETGSIWGPDSGFDDNGTPDDPSDDISVFNNVLPDEDNDGLPEAEYYSGGHTNALVPMWARGAGVEELAKLIKGNDATAADFWDEFDGGDWNGDYVDNTDLFKVMNYGVTGTEVPEPATMAVLGLGGLMMIRRRR